MDNQRKSIGLFLLSILVMLFINYLFPLFEGIFFWIIVAFVFLKLIIEIQKRRKSQKYIGEIIDFKMKTKEEVSNDNETSINCILVIKVLTGVDKYEILQIPELVFKKPTIGEKVNILVYDKKFENSKIQNRDFNNDPILHVILILMFLMFYLLTNYIHL